MCSLKVCKKITPGLQASPGTTVRMPLSTQLYKLVNLIPAGNPGMD